MENSLDYEKEIDAIRAKLYEESLTMSREEWQKKISDTAREAARMYGLKMIPCQSNKRSAA